MQNREFYSEAWEYVQQEIRDRFPDRGAYSEFINSSIGVDGTIDAKNSIFVAALVASAAQSGETRAMIAKQKTIGVANASENIAR